MNATETMYRAVPASQWAHGAICPTREAAERCLIGLTDGGTVEAIEIPMAAEIRFGYGEIINVYVQRGPLVQGLITAERWEFKGSCPAVKISKHNLSLSDAELIRRAKSQFGDRVYTVVRERETA